MRIQNGQSMSMKGMQKTTARSVKTPFMSYFMPETVPVLPDSLIYKNPPSSFREIAFEVSRSLLANRYDDADLSALIAEAFPFRVLVNPIDPRTYIMDLTYGPSGTSADFPAQFSVQLSAASGSPRNKPVLVVLTGETDADIALARAFSCIENVYCVFLYPATAFSSPYQQTMLRLAGNLQQVRVNGSMKDCKKLQQQVYADETVSKLYTVMPFAYIDTACLISAAFCNIYAALSVLSRSSYDNTIENPKLIMSFSVNSYNMLTAAVLTRKMKAPVAGYIAVAEAGDLFDSAVLGSMTGTHDTAYYADNLRRVKKLYGSEAVTSDMLFYRLNPAWREKAIDHCNEKTGVIISRDGAALWYAWNDIRSGRINTMKHEQKPAPVGVYSTAHSIPVWAESENYARSCMGVITETTHPALHAAFIKHALGQEPLIPHRFEQLQCSFTLLEVEAVYSELQNKIIHLI